MYFCCACINVRLIAVVQAPGAGDGAGLVPGQMQARDPLIPSHLKIKHTVCFSSTGGEEGIERVLSLCRKVVCAYGDASIAAAVRYGNTVTKGYRFSRHAAGMSPILLYYTQSS
jgi:hypothetical protein